MATTDTGADPGPAPLDARQRGLVEFAYDRHPKPPGARTGSRRVETDTQGTAAKTWRLYKLPNSSPDDLIAGYEQLTDKIPTDRIADDPRGRSTPTEKTSSEARPG